MVAIGRSESGLDVLEVVIVDGSALDLGDDGEEVVERGDGLEWPEGGVAEGSAPVVSWTLPPVGIGHSDARSGPASSSP